MYNPQSQIKKPEYCRSSRKWWVGRVIANTHIIFLALEVFLVISELTPPPPPQYVILFWCGTYSVAKFSRGLSVLGSTLEYVTKQYSYETV